MGDFPFEPVGRGDFLLTLCQSLKAYPRISLHRPSRIQPAVIQLMCSRVCSLVSVHACALVTYRRHCACSPTRKCRCAALCMLANTQMPSQCACCCVCCACSCSLLAHGHPCHTVLSHPQQLSSTHLLRVPRGWLPCGKHPDASQAYLRSPFLLTSPTLSFLLPFSTFQSREKERKKESKSLQGSFRHKYLSPSPLKVKLLSRFLVRNLLSIFSYTLSDFSR